MRVLIAAAVLLGAAGVSVLSTSSAEAREYPWCAQYGRDSGTNCGFATFAQCQAARSGNGGYCYRNPFFRGYAQGRPYREHRRDY